MTEADALRRVLPEFAAFHRSTEVKGKGKGPHVENGIRPQ